MDKTRKSLAPEVYMTKIIFNHAGINVTIVSVARFFL
jgi:hypothetical protein